MYFIDYKGKHESLLALNQSYAALDAVVCEFEKWKQSFSFVERDLGEDRFSRDLEGAPKEKRPLLIAAQQLMRFRYISEGFCGQMLTRRMQNLMPQLMTDIAAIKSALAGLDTASTVPLPRQLAENNYLLARCLLACAVDRHSEYHCGINASVEEIARKGWKALKETFEGLPTTISLSTLSVAPDWITHIPPSETDWMPVKDMELEQSTSDMLRLQQLSSQTGALWQTASKYSGLVAGSGRLKGQLNEKNYGSQLEEATGDDERFDSLRRAQQRVRAQYQSGRAVLQHSYEQLRENLESICEVLTHLRNSEPPSKWEEQARFYSNCLMAFWNAHRHYLMMARYLEEYKEADHTKGKANHALIHSEALELNANLKSVDFVRRRSLPVHTLWSHPGEDGRELHWLQLFANRIGA